MAEFTCAHCGKTFTRTEGNYEERELLENLGPAALQQEYVIICDTCYKTGMKMLAASLIEQRIPWLDITIYTTADGAELEAAYKNWYVRTEDHTALSLCNYINSKGLHAALTQMPRIT